MIRKLWREIVGVWYWRNPTDRMAYYMKHVYGFEGNCPCHACRSKR